MTIEKLQQRVAELKAELEQVVAQANREIGARQGAIAELERLVAELARE
jgi:hypothetical protein